MGNTRIEWATKVWNPVTGCVPAPPCPGCRNCYARRMANRLAGRFGYPADEPFRVTFHPDRLGAPKKWFRERVFVNSMGDLFLAPWEQIDAVFSAMYHDRGDNVFIILTKQPDRAVNYFEWMWNRDDAPMPRGDYRRIVIGTSVSDQSTADEFIPEILKIRRFTLAVSIEPMLGPVDLSRHLFGAQAKKVLLDAGGTLKGLPSHLVPPSSLDWVIAGGETGPGARPMHPDWPRSLRDQCQAAGVPFFFKQWGEYYPCILDNRDDPGTPWRSRPDGLRAWGFKEILQPPETWPQIEMLRVGKKAAGCLLDSREWKEFPA